jgi:hypothetical protein
MTPTTTVGIRVIELPSCTMSVASGPDLPEFDTWWTSIDAQRIDRFYPRDFMYFDSAMNQLVWMYALLPDAIEACPYRLVDFAGGLYAVAVSRDQDDTDGERVYRAIQEWIQQTGYFVLDERQGRPTLFHVITPNTAYEKMHYRQLDVYVPIK